MLVDNLMNGINNDHDAQDALNCAKDIQIQMSILAADGVFSEYTNDLVCELTYMCHLATSAVSEYIGGKKEREEYTRNL